MFGLEKVKKYIGDKQKETDADSFKNSDEELEEGDMTALLVSAAVVFLPIIGIMGLIVIFLV